MNKIEQVFLMAAGRGERMRPITDNIPKPLVPVAGQTMLGRIINKINELPDIKNIVINAYYLSEKIESFVQDLNNPKITLSKETTKLETAGGLMQALPLFDQTKPILIINSDIIWQDSDNEILRSLIANFDENKMDILLGLKSVDDFLGYDGKGDFDFDLKTKELSKPSNKESFSHVYVGIQIFHPKIMKHCPPPPLSLSHFYKKARQENGILERVFGTKLPGKIFHVGTVESVKEAEKELAKITTYTKT